ncbi:MAG: hypothetical protein WA658_09955 [Candidatus Acidiferrales bacterium]
MRARSADSSALCAAKLEPAAACEPLAAVAPADADARGDGFAFDGLGRLDSTSGVTSLAAASALAESDADLRGATSTASALEDEGVWTTIAFSSVEDVGGAAAKAAGAFPGRDGFGASGNFF